MASSKIFRLFMSSTVGGKNTPLTAGQIAAANFVELPITSLLGDLNITTGESLSIPNIGGKLKNDWKKLGSISAEGSFKVPLTPGLVDSLSPVIERSYGQKLKSYISGAVSSVTGDAITISDNVANDIKIPTNNLCFGSVSGGVSGECIFCYNGTHPANGTILLTLIDGPAGIDSGDTIVIHDHFDITKKLNDTSFYTFLAVSPNGYVHSLEMSKLNLVLGGGTESGIMEMEFQLMCMYLNPDEETDAFQTAMTNKIATYPDCIPYYDENVDFTVQRYGKCFMVPDSTIASETAVSSAGEVDLNGDTYNIIDAELMHTRTMAKIKGSTQFNAIVDIKETENTVSFKMNFTEVAAQKFFTAAAKDKRFLSFAFKTFDGKFGFVANRAQATMVTSQEDKDGMHTFTVEFDANLLCGNPTLVYLEAEQAE